MSKQPTTEALQKSFQITPESVSALWAFLQQGKEAAVLELKKITPLLLPAQPSPQEIEKLQEIKQGYVNKLATCKLVHGKMQAKRKEFTNPVKDALIAIMEPENSIDPEKEVSLYGEAWKIIANFDQQVLEYNKRETAKAELEKRRNKYKADIKASVEKRLLEMMTGQKTTLTTGMIQWESGLTLADIDAKETKLKAITLSLSKEKYEACFHTNFQKNLHLLTEEQTAAYIQSLKTEFTYEKYNEEYLRMAAPIKNAYLAKIPDVKAKLLEIKGNQEAEATRKKDLEDQSKTVVAEIKQEAEVKLEAIEHTREMGHQESEFQQQGVVGQLPTQNSKKVASFENEAMWLKPLMEVIAHVAITKPPTIKNAKGEYVPEIAKWLKAFEGCHNGKAIAGIVMTDEAKTVIKASKP